MSQVHLDADQSLETSARRLRWLAYGIPVAIILGLSIVNLQLHGVFAIPVVLFAYFLYASIIWRRLNTDRLVERMRKNARTEGTARTRALFLQASSAGLAGLIIIICLGGFAFFNFDAGPASFPIGGFTLCAVASYGIFVVLYAIAFKKYHPSEK